MIEKVAVKKIELPSDQKVFYAEGGLYVHPSLIKVPYGEETKAYLPPILKGKLEWRARYCILVPSTEHRVYIFSANEIYFEQMLDSYKHLVFGNYVAVQIERDKEAFLIRDRNHTKDGLFVLNGDKVYELPRITDKIEYYYLMSVLE